MRNTELGAKKMIKTGSEIVKELLKKDFGDVRIHLIIQSILIYMKF